MNTHSERYTKRLRKRYLARAKAAVRRTMRMPVYCDLCGIETIKPGLCGGCQEELSQDWQDTSKQYQPV